MRYKTSILFSLLLLLLNICVGQTPVAEVVRYDEVIEAEEGKLVKKYYIELKINNRFGDTYAEVQIPNSGTSNISKIEGELLDSNRQRVRKLRNKEIETSSLIQGFSLYEDNTLTEFELKYNHYPYYVRYSYQQKAREFLHITSWTPVIFYDIPTRKATLKIITPSDYPLNVFENMVQHQYITDDGKQHYIWEASYEKQIYQEKYIPPLDEIAPYVKVSPQKFEFEEYGYFESWVAFGEWQLKVMNDLGKLTMKERAKIDQLTQNIETKEEKLRVLYHYLQDNTRYINVSVETGGLVPYPASYVCENRYGDCKALTNYFKAVLNYAGIDSYYTKVYAGEKINKIEKTFFGSQFNHIILAVPLYSDTVWLDCTSSGPYKYLGTFTQNRQALAIQPGESHFIKTPALSISEVLEERFARIDYSPTGIAKVEVNERLRGKEFEMLQGVVKQIQKRKQRDFIINYFVESGIELEDYSIHRPHRDSAFLDLSYKAYSSQIYEQVGADLLVKTFSFDIPSFESISERSLPLHIPYPIHQQDSLIYQIPTELQRQRELVNVDIKSQFGIYKKRVYQDGSRLTIVKSLLINPVRTGLKGYEQFYDFIEQVQKSENKNTFLINKN